MTQALVESLLQNVCKNKRYQSIDEQLIRCIIQQELNKGRSKKEVVKHVRAKLHQVGGAYQEYTIPYTEWAQTLQTLSTQIQTPEIKEFCLSALPLHRSTNERLPILSSFYAEILSDLPPVHSILDIACGLNPLTLPWMDLPDLEEYHACDIYGDMIEFLNHFFSHLNLTGNAFLCDLTTNIPTQSVDVAFAFKTIPCLEQVDKTIGARLISSINAPNIFVSFPVQSLGGREKGMRENYRQHFLALVEGQPWQIKEYLFSTELVFLIQK